MEIRSLAKTAPGAIFEAFGRAFADYEVQLNEQQFQAMMKRRGFDPELSFAAFDGDAIVAFTLNGIGNSGGVPTAYDTGTGTLKEYRGRGLATRIFEHSMPYLREEGIGQYLLEVLQHNTKAVSVYRNLGFEVTREFNYFIRDSGEVRGESGRGAAKTGRRVGEMCGEGGHCRNEPCRLERIDIEKFGAVLPRFWDFHPSWQNSFEAIKRASGDFISLGAFVGESGGGGENRENLAGYLVFEAASGDITQIAVDKRHRRRGIASLLLSEMIGLNRGGVIKAVNTDVSCDSITGFLRAKNMDVTGRQFEMVKRI